MANRISAVLSETDKTKIMTSLGDVKKTLPFLVTLPVESRKRNRKMGSKSVDYVNMNLQGAQAFPSALPPTVDTVEFFKDVSLINQLMPIRVQVASLLETLDDTMMAAGSDAMQTADLIYLYLKAAAKTNVAVKDLTADIASRFKGQGRKKIES